MSTRMLVIAVAALALAAPTAATARTGPVKPAAKQIVVKKTATTRTAKKVAQPKTEPRRLCICIVNPPWTPAPIDEQAWKRQYDDDLIAHGLDPIYGYVDPIHGYTFGLSPQPSTPSE